MDVTSDCVDFATYCAWYRDLRLVDDRLTLNKQLSKIVRWVRLS